jgi:hypothetical protein
MLWIAPAFSLVWSCVLPQWRPCTTGLVEFEKDREGCSVVSKRFFYFLLLVLTKVKVGMIFPFHTPLFLPSFTRSLASDD